MSDFMKSLSKIAIPVTLAKYAAGILFHNRPDYDRAVGRGQYCRRGLVREFFAGFFRGDRLSRHCCRDPDRPVHRRRQRAGGRCSLNVSLLCGALLSVLFLLAAGGFPAQILQLYTADGRIQQTGTVYFKTVALAYLPMALSTVLSAWLRCKEHAAIPFWASLGAVAANTG